MQTEFRAVALAGGGARGAFQAGALLCLAEHDMRFGVVSGTSIGSLNGAFLSQGDGSVGHLQQLCGVWRSLPDAGLLRPNPKALQDVAAMLVASGAPGVATLLAKLVAGKTALLDPAPLARVMDRWLDYPRIRASATNLIIALLPEVSPAYDLVTGHLRTVTYVEARRLDARELRSALLAAVAIPLVFPSKSVLSRRHADAGIADPVPARALYARGARNIVSIMLSDLTPQNRADFPGATLLQVRPSASIGNTLSSMLDFSRATIERLIDLGYEDARKTVAEVCELAREIVSLRERGLANEALARSLRDPTP